MRAISIPQARGRAAGFTLIEILIALAIFGILLAVGIPMMGNWLTSTKAAGATEFYAEGFRLARAQAVTHNAASRITLTENSTSGQYDWQVDICFPTPSEPCNDSDGTWSTATTVATGDPEGAAGFKSVVRSAATLPKTDVLQPTLRPAGATTVYFTPVGWVDTSVPARLTLLELAPSFAHAGEFPSTAVAITLAGMAAKCDPTRALPDSRACP
ncbi:type II secretion system protein [Zemynaea arenosa]|uniref:type II secretion system protein n=1 Tax=Zemynaea arenosa TaxID=2561931 RepID=UPI001E467E55|nr:type II secretion system protein [Massilia arenosa]